MVTRRTALQALGGMAAAPAILRGRRTPGDKPNLSREELEQIQSDYARDWDLGHEAHPCDLKSSTDPSGKVRSSYIPPPVYVA